MKLTYEIDPKLKITDSTMLREYVYGNNAELTMVGPAGTAHTYYIAQPRNASDFPPDIRFVYVFHDDTKFYLGMIEDGRFRCTKNSRFDESCETVKGAFYIIKLMNDQQLLDRTAMRLYQSGKCARCGRPIDSEYGLLRGFGKSCWQKHQIQRLAEEKLNAYLRPAAI